MVWTSIIIAISLGVMAICSIIAIAFLWRRRRNGIARIERVVIWITFLLVIVSLGLMTMYKVPQPSDKIDFSLLATVLAVLVTVLVGWQVWQALISREQLRDIEQRLRNSEQNTSDRIQQAISNYDIENSIMQNFIMGRSSIQLHDIVHLLNVHHHTGIRSDLVNQSFLHIGDGLQKLKVTPENENYTMFYRALISTIDAFETAQQSILQVDTENIDRILDAVRHDDVYREGIDKESIIRRLEAIKNSLPLSDSRSANP